jgi:hypothetical protein
MKKIMQLLVIGGLAVLIWRELPAIRRYLQIESM